MSLPLFRVLLRGQRMTLLFFGVGFALYALLIMALFPSISSFPALSDYLRTLPEGLLAAFGMDAETLGDFTKLPQYLGTEFFTTWNLVVVIFAVASGAGLIARAAERGTLELLLAHPIARARVVVTKYCSLLLSLASIGVVTGLIIIASSPLARQSVPLGGLAATVVQGVLLSAAIGGLATLCSVLWLDPRRALAAAGAMATLLYLLNVAASTLEWLRWAQPLSLFHFFAPSQIMRTGQPDGVGLLVCTGVAAVAVALAAIVLTRREISL